jgi:hypothetical protein
MPMWSALMMPQESKERRSTRRELCAEDSNAAGGLWVESSSALPMRPDRRPVHERTCRGGLTSDTFSAGLRPIVRLNYQIVASTMLYGDRSHSIDDARASLQMTLCHRSIDEDENRKKSSPFDTSSSSCHNSGS